MCYHCTLSWSTTTFFKVGRCDVCSFQHLQVTYYAHFQVHTFIWYTFIIYYVIQVFYNIIFLILTVVEAPLFTL